MKQRHAQRPRRHISRGEMIGQASHQTRTVDRKRQLATGIPSATECPEIVERIGR